MAKPLCSFAVCQVHALRADRFYDKNTAKTTSQHDPVHSMRKNFIGKIIDSSRSYHKIQKSEQKTHDCHKNPKKAS